MPIILWTLALLFGIILLLARGPSRRLPLKHTTIT
jgi:hypothetical protein